MPNELTFSGRHDAARLSRQKRFKCRFHDAQLVKSHRAASSVCHLTRGDSNMDCRHVEKLFKLASESIFAETMAFSTADSSRIYSSILSFVSPSTQIGTG